MMFFCNNATNYSIRIIINQPFLVFLRTCCVISLSAVVLAIFFVLPVAVAENVLVNTELFESVNSPI